MLVHDASQIANTASQLHDVGIDFQSTEGYFAIARFFMKITYAILDAVGLEKSATLFISLYSVLVFIVSFGVGLIIQWIVVKVVNRVARHWKSDIYQHLINDNFFQKCCRLIPALLFLIFIQFTLASRVTLCAWLTKITLCYIIILVALALCSLLNATWIHIDSRENKRRLPLKGIVQLAKGIVWIIAAIIVVAIIVDKSPASLLAGIGAFAAIVLLVFKDSILGVVAGVQLSENDSLHVGDWIKVGEANGTVMEVSLTQVKILNWDKTITTVPPYSLVSGSYTNMRNMQDSNTRRVMRSYMIDADTVIDTTDEMLDEFAKIPLLTDWIAEKRKQREEGKVQNVFNSAGLVDGSIETNLGVFRAYLKLYLDSHPNVDHSGGMNLIFITTLPQSSVGIPLQLYFFTNTSKWTEYEAITATIFEHLAVMLYRFKLSTFEYPSGRDTIIEGYLSEGKDESAVFGLPHPLFGSQDPTPPSSATHQTPPSSPTSNTPNI